ncbi:MAG: hypothetical protein KJ626_15565 [Verrucomicrobia bacterium]|nr:hypothetical protein [Verrucomicrobiota bacterium]
MAKKDPWIIGSALFALVTGVVLYAANLQFGELNQDEGWYLYSGQQVADGRLPYRDFAFTQAPLTPLVYSLAAPLVDRFGVAGGRIFTIFLGYLSALGAGLLAMRLVPVRWRSAAAVTAFALIVCNVYQSYFTTVVKTYALCGFFLTAGLLVLSYCRAGKVSVILSGILCALAAGTRISAGIVLPVIVIHLWFFRKDVSRAAWFWFGLGGGLGLAAVFVPFFIMAPEGTLFGVAQYHSLRSAGNVGQILTYKAGFISRSVQAYFVTISTLIALIGWRLLVKSESFREDPMRAPARFVGLLWAVIISVSVVHFSAPFPYEDYQVVIFPLLAAATASLLIRTVGGTHGVISSKVSAAVVALVLLSTAAGFSSPINQQWFSMGRDRIWWRLKETSDLQKLRVVGQWLKSQTTEGDLLLTQDTYLAVEAGLRVPEGLEMGPFSYFGEWETGRASAMHVVNREMLKDKLLTSDAEFAAFSGYGLSITCPQVEEVPDEEQQDLWDALLSRYRVVSEIPDFGQGHTTLRILKKVEGD